MSTLAEPTGSPPPGPTPTARGEAAHGLLHRHDRVHRLQGVRGRVQGVEPDSRGRPRMDRQELRQHRRAERELVAARRVHRAGEAAQARRRHRDGGRRPRAAALADGVGRVQALHARGLPRRLPDRLALPHRVRHGRRAGGHLQRLRLLRPGLPVRRHRQARPAALGRRRAARAAAAREEGGRARLEVHALLRPA